jgi:hypothetical protein
MLLAVFGGGGAYLYYQTYGLSLEGVVAFCVVFLSFSKSLYARIRGGIAQHYSGGYGYDSNNRSSSSTGNNTMYSGLAMESSSTITFEPPSLSSRPPPAAADASYHI